jgi:hypothetical protein
LIVGIGKARDNLIRFLSSEIFVLGPRKPLAYSYLMMPH